MKIKSILYIYVHYYFGSDTFQRVNDIAAYEFDMVAIGAESKVIFNEIDIVMVCQHSKMLAP